MAKQGHTIYMETAKLGNIQCDVFGDLETAKSVLLTVHDLGCNSSSWHNFVNQPCMKEISEHATWLHINLPGQEEGAQDLPVDFKYPTMDALAEGVAEVLEKVHCPVIGIGEGAGANIMARTALLAPKRLYGAVLIHCTSTTAGFMESIKDQTINWQLLGGINPEAENYLIMHRFGDFSNAKNADQVRAVVADYHKQLATRMNAKNIRGYLGSFMNRTCIAEKMGELKTPTMIITGQKASHNHTVHTFYKATLESVQNRQLVQFIEVQDVANVVEGAPEKLAESLLFFSQGNGVLIGAHMPHLTHAQSGKTMQEMDRSDV